MNLTKIKLPDTIEVSGSFYSIHTGHPYWFRFMQILKQPGSTTADFDYIYRDEIPLAKDEAFQALLAFCWEKKEIPRTNGDEGGPRVIDYDIDADMIWAAIFQVYGIDLAECEVHWHKVRAMLAALPGSRLEEVMGYRCYKGKDAKLLKLKRQWELPEPEDEASRDALDKFNALFD